MGDDRYVSESRPVIIGGAARSGTTLLSVMLNSHPEVVCGPESDLFRLWPQFERLSVGAVRRAWHLWRGWTEPFSSIGRDFGMSIGDLRRLWRGSGSPSAFIDRFFCEYAGRHGASRWADKTPANVKNIAYILRHFPNAKFIHMVRDGRDVCCSVQAWYRRYHEGRPLDMESAAETWARWVGLGRPWLGHPNYTEVRYEDLVLRTEYTVRRVLKFAGLRWLPAVLDFYRCGHENRPYLGQGHLRGVGRPVYASSVGRWRRELGPDDRAVVERIAGSMLRELGYTDSCDWVDNYDAVPEGQAAAPTGAWG